MLHVISYSTELIEKIYLMQLIDYQSPIPVQAPVDTCCSKQKVFELH